MEEKAILILLLGRDRPFLEALRQYLSSPGRE